MLAIGARGKKPLPSPVGFHGVADGVASLRRGPAAEGENPGGAIPGCLLEVFFSE